jgi:hypothetical protein
VKSPTNNSANLEHFQFHKQTERCHISLCPPNPSLPASKVLKKVGPVLHVHVKKKLRKKRESTVSISAEFTENKQKLKKAKAGREMAESA